MAIWNVYPKHIQMVLTACSIMLIIFLINSIIYIYNKVVFFGIVLVEVIYLIFKCIYATAFSIYLKVT